MPFRKIFRREEPVEEDIDIEDYLNEMSIREGKIIEREDITYIKPLDLDNEGGGLEEAIRELEKNNIVVLNVKQLLHNKVLLRDIIKRLRDVCIEIDGDIGRISHEKILLAPTSMRIVHRTAQ
ncbi:MAG: cell division protein SepF [Candidatus Altiarchaeota archaeon]|nr:cell division protein SepF [Candidatus Altiarchaeota archaeon]